MAAILAAGVIVTFALQSQTKSKTPVQTSTVPVVLELFTSQGCSSCPPADALLRRIARDPDLRGRVIPLAFHVDYWNRLGWRDPFSSREWSRRQGDYVRAMKLDSAYTPQMVVNGTRQMVGSSSGAVMRAIEEESRRRPEGSVSITRTATGANVRARTSNASAELVIVTFENDIVTNVTRGENGGKTLVNDAVVRTLTVASKLEAQIEASANEGVAAFLQERGTRRILAAATTGPARP